MVASAFPHVPALQCRFWIHVGTGLACQRLWSMHVEGSHTVLFAARTLCAHLCGPLWRLMSKLQAGGKVNTTTMARVHRPLSLTATLSIRLSMTSRSTGVQAGLQRSAAAGAFTGRRILMFIAAALLRLRMYAWINRCRQEAVRITELRSRALSATGGPAFDLRARMQVYGVLAANARWASRAPGRIRRCVSSASCLRHLRPASVTYPALPVCLACGKGSQATRQLVLLPRS
jgi:hypothetical protein